jgi:hypothetical protein
MKENIMGTILGLITFVVVILYTTIIVEIGERLFNNESRQDKKRRKTEGQSKKTGTQGRSLG